MPLVTPKVLPSVSGVTLMLFCLFIPYEMCQGLVVLAPLLSEVKKYQKIKIYKNYFFYFS